MFKKVFFCIQDVALFYRFRCGKELILISQLYFLFCWSRRVRKNLWNYSMLWLPSSLLFLHTLAAGDFSRISSYTSSDHIFSSPRYTYGQPIEGKVKLSVCRDFDSYGRCKKSPVCQSFTKNVWYIIIIPLHACPLFCVLVSLPLPITPCFFSLMLFFTLLISLLVWPARSSGHLISLLGFLQAWMMDVFLLHDSASHKHGKHVKSTGKILVWLKKCPVYCQHLLQAMTLDNRICFLPCPAGDGWLPLPGPQLQYLWVASHWLHEEPGRESHCDRERNR